MNTIKRILNFSLLPREVAVAKRIVAAILLPIMVFYMTSMNFLVAGMMTASAEGTAEAVTVVEQTPAVEKAVVGQAPQVEEVVAPTKNIQVEDSKTEVAPVASAPTVETSFKTETPSASDDFDITSNTLPTAPTVEAVGEASTEKTLPEWNVDGNKQTTGTAVELGKKYVAPQNDQVTVTFTKLPKNPGTLSIEEITLTDEQVASLHALSNKAYDITSSMTDGTFSYIMTLPKPKDQKNVQIKFAEDTAGLENADTIASGDVTTKTSTVSAKLDHFTIFYTVASGGTIDATKIVGGSVNPIITVTLQSDTFNVAGVSELSGNWTINTGVTSLAVGALTRISATKMDIAFTGTANTGTVSIQAKAEAVNSNVASNSVNIDVVAPLDIVVASDNFNTNKSVDYYGPTVGYVLSGAGVANVASVSVALYDGADNLLVTNTSKSANKVNIAKSYSSSFRIGTGTYISSSTWNFGSWNPSVNVKPARAIVTVADVNGVTYTATNTSMSEATATWESLFDINVTPENFNTNKSLAYYGPTVGFALSGTGVANVTSVSVALYDGSDNLLVTNTSKSADKVNIAKSYSSAFRVKTGTYTSSSTWNLGDASWTPSAGVKPTKAVVTVTDNNGITYTTEINSLSEATASWESLFPSDITITSENFNTNKGADYYGPTVGYALGGTQTANVASVSVALYDGANNLLVTNTSKSKAKIDNTTQGPHYSSAFIMTPGEYSTSSTWTFGSWTPSVGNKPAKAIVTVTDINGFTYETTINSMSEATATWESLFAKTVAHSALTTARALYDDADYSVANLSSLNGYKTAGDGEIDAATNLAGIATAQDNATNGMAGVVKDMLNAENAVEAAEAHPTEGNIATAYEKVGMLGDSAEKSALTVRIKVATFQGVSATLAADGSDIANNLDEITTGNITAFSGLYFEKSVVINGVKTKVGKITFTSALDMSASATTDFLQALGEKMDMSQGTISLDFRGTTDSVALKGKSATIEFYGLDRLGFDGSTTSDEVNAKLIAMNDDGTVVDKSSLVVSPGTYTPPVGACEVGGACYIFSVPVAHFTKYKIDDAAKTTPDSSGDATLSGETTQVVLDNANQDVTIEVEAGTENPTIDVSALLTGGTATLPEITINTEVAEVFIPAGTTVTGPAGWDGVISAPTAGTPSGGSAPAGFAVGDTVITLGSTLGTITFDTPVVITLPGVTGTVGYRPAGSSQWTEITNVCTGTYENPTGAVYPGECAISNGIDTKIVTFHFTSFGELLDTKAPKSVDNFKGVYSPITGDVKLTWDVNNKDTAKVSIYRGTTKHYDLNSHSRLNTQDRRDEDYTDADVTPGKTYYYKLVAKDEAGNKSDIRVIKITIPTDGGVAASTPETTEKASTENTTQEEVVATPDEAGVSAKDNSNQSDSGKGAVLGETTDQGNGNQQSGFWASNWKWFLALVLTGGAIFFWRKRQQGDGKSSY